MVEYNTIQYCTQALFFYSKLLLQYILEANIVIFYKYIYLYRLGYSAAVYKAVKICSTNNHNPLINMVVKMGHYVLLLLVYFNDDTFVLHYNKTLNAGSLSIIE